MIAANTRNTLLLMGALSLVGAAGTGCTVKDQPNYLIAPQINPMMFSKAVESQTKTDLFKNGRSLQIPPAGTLPRRLGCAPLRVEERQPGQVAQTLPEHCRVLRVHYDVTANAAKAAGVVDDKGVADLTKFATAQAVKAGQELINPTTTAGEVGAENMARGEAVFTTFCAPCHGVTGAGDGPVAARGVGMPGFPLTTKGAAPLTFKDGHIFHIITYGRGNMGSYASQIGPEDRWKAILWLRQLQKGGAI